MPGPDPPLPPWLRVWNWLRALGRVLWLARFSVVFVAIGTVALLANDQAQEVLREFAARRSGLRDLLQIAILLLATLLWCWNAWSWARMLTSLRMPGAPEPDGTELALRIAVPRVLGAVAAFAVPAAMWIAADAYAEYAAPFAQQLRWVAIVMFAGAVAFVAYVVFRRRFRAFAVRRPATDAARGRLEWNELPAFDRATLWITAGITVTLFTLFLIDAATTAPWFGSAPILLAALAAWIPFGSLLVWLSNRWHARAAVFAVPAGGRGVRVLERQSRDPHAGGNAGAAHAQRRLRRPGRTCGSASDAPPSGVRIREALARVPARRDRAPRGGHGRALFRVPGRGLRRRHSRRVLDRGTARVPARPRSEVHRTDVRDQRRVRRQPRCHGLCRTGARESRRPGVCALAAATSAASRWPIAERRSCPATSWRRRWGRCCTPTSSRASRRSRCRTWTGRARWSAAGKGAGTTSCADAATHGCPRRTKHWPSPNPRRRCRCSCSTRPRSKAAGGR